MAKKFIQILFFIYSILMPVSYFQAMSQAGLEVVASNCEQDISKKLDAYMHALTKLNRFSGSVIVAKGNKILLNTGLPQSI